MGQVSASIKFEAFAEKWFQEAKARNCEAITSALSFGNKKEPQTEKHAAV